MIDLPYQSPSTSFPDQSGRYVAVGVILLVIAAFAALFTLLIPSVVLLQPQTVSRPEVIRSLVPAVMLYGGIFATAVWVGIGALRKRRWVRPIVQVLGVIWLLSGILSVLASVAMFVWFLPAVVSQSSSPQTATLHWSMSIGLAISIAFTLGFMVVVPGILLWLMKSDDARLTAKHYDPRPRWTDGRSTKVLGLVFSLALLAVFHCVSIARPVVPAFGVLLTGLGAAMFLIFFGVLQGWAAVQVYRGRMSGWWVGLIASSLPPLLAIPSMLLVNPDDFSAAAGLDPQVAELVRQRLTSSRVVWTFIMAFFVIGFAIYMVRVKPLVAAVSVPQPLPPAPADEPQPQAVLPLQ